MIPALAQAVRNGLILARLGPANAADLVVRRLSRKPAAGYHELRALVAGKRGIEVGGPSGIFREASQFPVYPDLGKLDGANFSPDTVWHEGFADQGTYRTRPEGSAGTSFLREATDLAGIADGTYEFLLSSHCLEHCANPLKALREWARVVAPGGTLFVVVPDRRATFDHRRDITTFAHLLSDFDRGMGEDDQFHVDEILKKHDYFLDPGVAGREEFAARARDNLRLRSLHHHVFDADLLAQCLRWAGLSPRFVHWAAPHHIVGLATRAPADPPPR